MKNINLKKSLDLCFTSPPYFDTEKYSDEDTQSYKKFPTEDGWVNGFFEEKQFKIVIWFKR